MEFSSFTLDDLRSFHCVDREIYKRLVMVLMVHPMNAMHIMALWLWLGESGFPDIILRLKPLGDNLLKSVVEEARRCLNCLTTDTPPKANDQIPHMRNLLDGDERMSLQFLFLNRLNVLSGVTKMVNNVSTVFDDIMQQAIGNAATAVPPPPSSMFISRGVHELGESSTPSNQSNLNARAAPFNPNDIPQAQRTMFATFSRGYPISESEVLNFITKSYGDDLVEAIQMEVVENNRQPLYAKIIFKTAATIGVILNGQHQVQFTINGKHMRVRRYVSK